MRTYAIQLSVPSGFITHWHADTVWGHLCWAAQRHEGFSNFAGAAGFIDLYRSGEPPLIISDAFPAGYLPAPANLRAVFDQAGEALDASRYALLKQVKGLEFITLAEFQNYRAGQTFAVKDHGKPLRSAVTLHNQINRFTNTTGNSGSLFELDEQFAAGGRLTIYARLAGGFEEDARRLFELVSAGGFGKKKSTGKGAFAVEGFEVFSGFDASGSGANGFVSLSHFVPAKGDPPDGVYKTVVKYGKLGEEKTFCGNPFKKPLVMLKPGAVFRTAEVKPWYGRLVENIAYIDPSVVQYAYAFAVPLAMP
jgi:CRISPR-associated protein Csm4